MRSLLPESRRVNGYALLEGALEEAHHAMMAHIGQGIGARLSAAVEHVLGAGAVRAPRPRALQHRTDAGLSPVSCRAEPALQSQWQPAAPVVDALG
jgi:hypothetical protein